MKTEKGSQQVLPAPRGETIAARPPGLHKFFWRKKLYEEKKKKTLHLSHQPVIKRDKGGGGLIDVWVFWKPLMLFLLENAAHCLIYTF